LEHCYVLNNIIWLPILQPTEDKDHVLILLSESDWIAKYKLYLQYHCY